VFCSLVGTGAGTFRYFLNTGTATSPAFSAVRPPTPFDTARVAWRIPASEQKISSGKGYQTQNTFSSFLASPTCFKNPRNKGLVDCVVGQDKGPENGGYEIRGRASIIPGTYFNGYNQTKGRDPDMLASYKPFLTYHKNIGSATEPTFREVNVEDQATSRDIMKASNADGTTTAHTGRNPSCADFDGASHVLHVLNNMLNPAAGDGDIDCVVGNYDGSIGFLWNVLDMSPNLEAGFFKQQHGGACCTRGVSTVMN
jgi:hypothetical protein